jgi:hypothetical protein
MLEPDRVAYSFTLPHELPAVEFNGPGRRGENALRRLCVLFVVFLLPMLPSYDVSPSISLIVPKNGERDQGVFLW